ncbi:MAG: hypothetical protein ABJD23_10885, partial [Nonlabens sp.]
MKHFFYLIILLLNASALAQSGREVIDWKDLESFDIGNQQIKVPFFEENHSFDGQNLFWIKSFEINQKVNEFSVEITNLRTETISATDLGQLNPSQISIGFQYTLRNALSRKRNYAQLKISPIYKDGNQYKKVVSFNYSYSYAPAQFQVKNASFSNSILASGNWYRFRVERTGVNRISRSFLSNLGIDVNSIDPSRIKVYGQGGTSLPLVNSDDQLFDSPEVAITVTGSEDGRFDNGDEILFYGIATDTDYVSENDSFINPYTDESFYYLTVDGVIGKRILPFVQPSATPTITYDYYYARQHHEVDLVNIASIGRVWYGERFDFEPEQVFEFEFENVLSNLPAIVRIATGAVSDNDTSMSFSLNDVTLGTSSLNGVVGQNIRAAARATLLVSNASVSSDMVS